MLQGIQPSDVILSREDGSDDAVLTVVHSASSTSDGATLTLPSGLSDYFGYGVERIYFADGTSWTKADMQDMH